MEHIQGATSDLSRPEHLVNLIVQLKGASGVVSVDYRTNARLLAAVGERLFIRLVRSPTIELVTATDATISYNIRAVHYDRSSADKPPNAASIAATPGSVEIVRSQLQNENNKPVGETPGMTLIVKPDPVVGYSPRLDIGWTSLGTNPNSIVQLIVHCVIEATGTDLPGYQS
jgi:hypothetical protein